MNKKLPQIIYAVNYNSLETICKLSRDYYDKNHFRPLGSFTNTGKYKKDDIPKWAVGGFSAAGNKCIRFFRSKSEAEVFRQGAASMMCFLINNMNESLHGK